MALPVISKHRKIFAVLSTFWIPIKKYRKAARGIMLMGVRNYCNVRKREKLPFENYLSVVVVSKDEGADLKEWLEYHRMVGVEKFYFCDNDSTDNTMEILKPYIDAGIVVYGEYPGAKRQNDSYIDVLNKYSDKTRWLALIDMDEFLVPVNHKTIPEFLKTLPQDFAQLAITWVIYGFNGHETRPDGLVIENYKKHSTRTWGVKSIVNPRLVVCQTNPHLNDVAGFTIDENGTRLGRVDQTNNPPSCNKIRCNHYLTKSVEQYARRRSRGSACTGEIVSGAKREFEEKYKEEIQDDIMDKYIPELKSRVY